jgi:hypothetical protein
VGRSETSPDPNAVAGWCVPFVAVEAAARRFLARSLCCVVEVRSPGGTDGRASWEPRLIVFREGSARQVMEALADTVRELPRHDVRIAGYEGSRLTAVEDPSPVVCVRASAA